MSPCKCLCLLYFGTQIASGSPVDKEHGEEQNFLFDPPKSVYRRRHSTETALLRVKSDIDMALIRGEGTLLLLLHLSAAFDTADHTILLTAWSENWVCRPFRSNCSGTILLTGPRS